MTAFRKHGRFLLPLAYVSLAAIFSTTCDTLSDPSLGDGQARLMVTATVSESTTDLVLEVTGPDIGTPLQFNLTVTDMVASGTISVPTGSDRTITARAYNANAIETHRGEATVDVVEGTNATISITLFPLVGEQPILVYVGSVVLRVTPSRALAFLGGTLQMSAAVLDADGNTVGERVHWGSTDPSKATIDTTGLLTAHEVGEVEIWAIASGVAGHAEIEIRTLLDMVEAFISNAYAGWFGGVYDGDPAMGLSAAADEFTISWGNFAMQQLSSEPRVAWPNESTFEYARFTENPWYEMYKALGNINDALRLLDSHPDASDPDGSAPRARVFGKFVQGLCHGWLALMFDRAFVVDESVDLYNDELELLPYQEVWAVAQAELEEAIAMADTISFTLPEDWINGNAMNQAKLQRLIHSQLARWIPQVARTPAQREAIDWAAVVSHVDAGLQEDFFIQGDGGDDWWHSLLYYGFQTTSNTWSRADYKTIGWAESDAASGNCGATDDIDCYSEWLAAPVASRDEFVLNSPDLRIHPAGDGLGAGLDFQYHGASQFQPARGTYHYSYYIGTRYEEYFQSGEYAPAIYMTTVEMALTKAEGLLRTGGPSQAVVDIINATRVTRGGLTPAAATESQADLLDKIIYEKRIENYGVCSGCAFFDRRGWGPLAPTGPDHHQGHVEGTPLHFPVPAKELYVLGLPTYTFGGVGNELTPVGAAAGPIFSVPARVLFEKRLRSVGVARR